LYPGPAGGVQLRQIREVDPPEKGSNGGSAALKPPADTLGISMPYLTKGIALVMIAHRKGGQNETALKRSGKIKKIRDRR